ncbi:hypothetical protein Nepgr_027354 [Nepenthes gracilis]|uniref:Nucleolar pre-ribosomal-associated protein 1 n=1 Tax=Nepenthes gracilis TaxID=150966 RepID=A0AAD3TAD1_NEPGR|nr:hypothetical protein Nepgr_027354 [Nepenthes gracilis]
MADNESSPNQHEVYADDHHVVDEVELDGGEGIPKLELKASYEAKLREVLRKITSIEVKLCSDGSKEFKKLLRSSSGSELLRQYVTASSKLIELQEAWKIRRGKPGLSYLLSLIAVILDHRDGKYTANDHGRIGISRVLDKFSKLIIEEKLDDIYKELNSKEGKRQKPALLLMAAIARRGSGLAAEVAKNFNFKLPIFLKLAEYKRRQVEGMRRRKHSTRGAFIEFAMSFLEVGKPGSLRWVLRQKEMFSGILRGLGDDDDENVVYVLSTLRDKVLVPQSLVPPSLRSVLFGSVTLEQLARISAREDGDIAAKVAHNVLFMVCTDPSNGLMPDLKRQPNPLRGNLKRLVGLMKKLKATEIKYHRELLLAIVNGRPSLGSAYLDEYPYNLEDHASPAWLSAVYLAANLVYSVSTGISWDFLCRQAHDPPGFHSSDVQSVMRCVCPHSFNRLVINKGLLHSDPVIKHGTLKLLLENLKLLNSFIDALSINEFSPLKREIQNEVRVLLPDPQVLFALLNSLSSNYKSPRHSLKRIADSGTEAENYKKLKTDTGNKDIDIVVGGININSFSDSVLLQDIDKIGDKLTTDKLDDEKDHDKIAEIWGLHRCFTAVNAGNDVEVYFHCKVLEVLRIYHRALCTVLEVSYDFFKILPGNPLTLPSTLLQSLLPVLIDNISKSSMPGSLGGSLPSIYKYLQPFINLLIYSPVREIKDQAYVLAQAAILSTGAFDSNPQEVAAWFLFLPGYTRDSIHVENQKLEFFQNLSPVVVSFLCDAVSSLGNNLIRYWDRLRCLLHHLKGCKGMTVRFSPLVICVLEKCLRLLNAESETFTLPEKSMISLYVSNTLKFVLETQVEAELLSNLINQFLSERVEDRFVVSDPANLSCEWRPLKYLLFFSQSISSGGTCNAFSVSRNVQCSSSSFASTLIEVKKFLKSGRSSEFLGVCKSFYFSLICTTPEEIIENLPSIMTISQKLPGFCLSLLTSVFFLDQSLFDGVYTLWPDMFSSGLEMSAAAMSSEMLNNDDNSKHSHLSSPEIHCGKKFDSVGVAFGSFLRTTPFCQLFPMIIIPGCVKHYSGVKQLLLAKLSKLTTGQLISSVQLVLFWIHQIWLSCGDRSADNLEHFYETCYTLVEHILSQLQLANADSGCSTAMGVSLSIQNGQQVAETIFSHPVVKSSLSCPLQCGDEFTEEMLGDSLENVLFLSGQTGCKMDRQILNLLALTSEYLLGLCSGQNSIAENYVYTNQVLSAFKKLLQQIFNIFKERFSTYVVTRDKTYVLPTLSAVLALKCFISPFELLELAHWMFSKADLEYLMLSKASKISPIDLGFLIASYAFEMLSRHLLLPYEATGNLFWGTKEKKFDATLFESIYSKALECSSRIDLNSADICLLKAVTAVQVSKSMQNFLPSSMEMARVIASTPIEIVSHCVHRISITKAKLLLVLIEMSPLHMSVFGHVFSDTLNRKFLLKDNLMEETHSCYHSDEEYLMLLPAALLYLNSALTKFGKQYSKKIESIPVFYSRLLMDGFIDWKNFVSRTIFQVECENPLPSSSEQLLHLFSNSLLGKAVDMLQYHFAISGLKINQRLKLFLSIFPGSVVFDELLDFDINVINSCSLDQLLNIVNRVFTKTCLCRILLFSEGDNSQFPVKEAHDGSDHPDLESDGEYSSRIRFIDALVSTWQLIVNKFPHTFENSGKNSSYCLLFRFLEVFVLRSICELIMKMQTALIQLDCIPFLEKIARLSFLHRFGDPTIMKIFRHILSSLSKGNMPSVLFLQLLLGHSQLAPTIQSVNDSACSDVAGMFLRPISSILRYLVTPERRDLCKSEVNIIQLEVVKLLRILFNLKSRGTASHSNNYTGINTRELLFLLLSSYGATVSEIDLEIYNLMDEIDSAEEMDSGKLAELDYLWGSAAIRIRRERAQEQDILLESGMSEMERDHRRNQFRENLPIDPKLCVATVLYFPYKRNACDGPLSSDQFHNDNAGSAEGETIELYNPLFILRFSIHSLSMEYLDPVEFAGLGLLAIALVSISSPDDGIRKLGYEVLGRFRSALEKCQRKNEVKRLRLLLICLQNGIEEPWQKLPTIIAIFVAEASIVLLDPSNDHYAAISKLLMRSPRINMKGIPFFRDFFWSDPVNFKTDKLWMLILLYSGINSEEDAKIYLKNSVLEVLLSFYASPLSSNESKELILQVVKKSLKFEKMACYLVENCGLVPWLSSILSYSLSLGGVQDLYFPKQLNLLLQVANDVVSSRGCANWLQKNGFEQLSDLSSQLFKILVSGSKLVEKDVFLVESILKVVISALQISQKREIYQPHFTLSMEGLYKLFEAVDQETNGKLSPSAEFGLKAILTSPPPVTLFQLGQLELQLFLTWAISTALKLDSMRVLQQAESYPYCTQFATEDICEDSLMSKLLRWLTASVILCKISHKYNGSDSSFLLRKPNMATLLSLVKYFENECGETMSVSGSKDMLAAAIVYLQQLLGMKCKLLSSVVTALSLLLLADAPSSAGCCSILGRGSHISLLWSKIRCPPEANPAWRWSFDQPWADPSSEQSDLEKIDELHACQTLLVVLSEALGKKLPDSRRAICNKMQINHVEEIGFFQWKNHPKERLCDSSGLFSGSPGSRSIDVPSSRAGLDPTQQLQSMLDSLSAWAFERGWLGGLDPDSSVRVL